MNLVRNTVQKLYNLIGEEISSSEKHFVYLHETPKTVMKGKSDSSCIRKIQTGDRFQNDHYKKLSEIFLGRGELGLGYFSDNVIVGFFWVRPGKTCEQLGRETLIIPGEYAVLHHLMVTDEYRCRGIAKALLKDYVEKSDIYGISKTIAFVRQDNAPSSRAFVAAGFIQKGEICSVTNFGKRSFYNSSEICIGRYIKMEYRSLVARSLSFPVKILTKPYLGEDEVLVDGAIGGRPWLCVLSACVLPDTGVGILHASSINGTPVLMPCSVKVGRKFGQMRIQVEPTLFQAWPRSHEHIGKELISAIAKISSSRWVDSLSWPLPFWMTSDIEGLELPLGCSISKRDEPTWVINIDADIHEIEKRYSKTSRTYIRQAEKRGVVICDVPDSQDIREFASLWLSSYNSRSWKGLKYSELFYFAINKYLNDGASIVLAKINGKIIGGGVFVRDALGFVHLLGAMNREYDSYRPMYAVISHIVKKSVRLGLKYVNLGGTGGQSNLVSFKQHWGAEPKDLYWLQIFSSNHISKPRLLDRLYVRFFRLYLRSLSRKTQNIIARDI